MKHAPLVSIIVNCYNSSQYLSATIDSILAQTFTNYEVIYWDNQSTDDTEKIIKSYPDSRFHYYYAPEHTSLGEARNQAMTMANGKYLTFLDSDDIWLPGFLKKAIDCLLEGNYLLYYANYYNWIEGSSIEINNIDRTSGLRSFKDLLSNYRVGMSAAVLDYGIVKKKSIKFDSRYQLIEDYDFFLNLTRWGNAYYDTKPLMKYRIHETSLTNSSKKNWGIEFEMLYQKLMTTTFDYEERKRYARQLKWLKVRAINAYAEEYIRKRKRMSLMKWVLKNWHLSIQLFFPLLYLVMSQKCYYKLKAKMQKSLYHV